MKISALENIIHSDYDFCIENHGTVQTRNKEFSRAGVHSTKKGILKLSKDLTFERCLIRLINGGSTVGGLLVSVL